LGYQEGLMTEEKQHGNSYDGIITLVVNI
jgi:hypothetical protein